MEAIVEQCYVVFMLSMWISSYGALSTLSLGSASSAHLATLAQYVLFISGVGVID